MGDGTDASEETCPQPGGNTFVLTGSKLVIGEGNDECVLLRTLAKATGLTQEMQFAEYGGKDNLSAWLRVAANQREFRQSIQTILVLRDADASAEAALKSVQGALKQARLPVPATSGAYAAAKFAGRSIRVGVFVFPGARRKIGSLETLCYKSVTDLGAKECVDLYLQCLKKRRVELPANRDKTKAYAYIATGKRGGFAVGRAAQHGYWDFGHPAWNELKKMLREM
ncbi:MAG: hypothetical protein KKI08_27145 [Armatimonadetes bacterium]|nr:hypothetical protein [Armatimonadota bacterium]